MYLPGAVTWNHNVSSFPASAVASDDLFDTHSELSEKVTPMYCSESDTDPMFKETTPAMFFPKSYAVAASPSNTELPDEDVRLSGLLTDPLKLCTDTGKRILESGARMYSEYGIARTEETKLKHEKVLRAFIVQLFHMDVSQGCTYVRDARTVSYHRTVVDFGKNLTHRPVL